VAVPSRNQWRTAKKKYGVPDGAVKGIDLGKELDKVSKAASGGVKGQAAYVAALKVYLDIASKYLTTLGKDQKAKAKITKWAEFQKHFLDEYVQPAHETIENVKLAADGKKFYKVQLQKWFQAVQKLDPKKSTYNDCEVFTRQTRNLDSAALRTKGAVDKAEVSPMSGKIDAAFKKLDSKTAGPNEIGTFVKKARAAANEVADWAKTKDLV
jgi:hypothetical protein